MTRAERRHQIATAKSKAARILRQQRVNPDPAMVGKAAATHNTCDCAACTTKDKEPTRQILSDLTKLHADT